MSVQQINIELSRSQAKPSKKVSYPYTEFDLTKAKKQLCDQFNVPKLGYYRSIIELLMNTQNLQFKKETHKLKPQIGHGETLAVSDVWVAEEIGCSVGIVGDCRRDCKKAGLWSVVRAKGKHGNARCGIWVYAFIGYLTLHPEQPKEIVVHEVKDNILEIDFEGTDSSACSEEKVPSARKESSEYSEKTEADEQPSNPSTDRVSASSEISAKKTILKKQYSSSIEGTNGEEEDKIKAEKPVEYTRNEPIQTVPSIVEETLDKVSKIRMNETGRNPVGEAEKPDFRKWLDMYAHKRSKDLDITYEEALIVLPLAWDLANRASRYYRPDTPCYFANGRSNKYAMSYLHDALALWVQGEEFEPQEQEAETVDIETILGQDYDDDPVDSEEQELQMYIRKYRVLLKAREGNGYSALERVMKGAIAQKLGEETVKRLLKLEGIVS